MIVPRVTIGAREWLSFLLIFLILLKYSTLKDELRKLDRIIHGDICRMWERPLDSRLSRIKLNNKTFRKVKSAAGLSNYSKVGTSRFFIENLFHVQNITTVREAISNLNYTTFTVDSVTINLWHFSAFRHFGILELNNVTTIVFLTEN